MFNIKDDFPLLNKNPNLVYLDNAATTQKPIEMLDALSDYYTNSNSNIGRGLYKLAQLSEKCYVDSKNTIAQFIGTKLENIVYTNGCTDSLNLAAYIAIQKVNKQIGKKYIVLPISEHHANILIWQRIAKENKLELFWIKDAKLILEPEKIPLDILKNTAILAIAHVSNVTGEVYPVEKWCSLAKKIGAISIVDGAQSVATIKVNIKNIECDFYAFSAHKIYGPMGLGVLFINNKFLDSEPLKLGGGIIEDVDTQYYTLLEDSSRFESGTPNVANAYAFSKTIEYLNKNNWEKLLYETHQLGEYLSCELNKIGIQPLSISDKFAKTHISSFSIANIHSHDVGTYLSQKNIAVRVGKHCAFPLHAHLNVKSSVRASVGIYNTKNDIDCLIANIQDCIKYFNKE